GLGDGEGAVALPQLAVEGQLAEQHVRRQPLAWRLFAGGENRAREGEVEAGTRLAHVARREAGRDAPGREVEPGVANRGLHANTRLAYGRVGQADDRERGQPGADVHLNRYAEHLQPVDRER